MEDYKDKVIEKLMHINEEQIKVNSKFADVTKKNNNEYQKTFKLLIICAISAIVIVCIFAMCLIHIAENNNNNNNNNTNINSNINKSK